ncbi:MAG: formylglycine-generating enzyme family protein [Ilumatobacteraceae bacterium]|nr:formylglycine-generating enzyme family protein [Ilumatobacteraceae bacterium]
MFVNQLSSPFIQIGPGDFCMGSDSGYPEEAPEHKQAVQAFAIASTPVTNFDFGRFVVATKYQTQAEHQSGSIVFHQPLLGANVEELSWWQFEEGASWYSPTGPASGIADKPTHPVVHISFIDALAYCEWADCRMPNEIEWEYAARGSTHGTFAWGNDLYPNGQVMANHWVGEFPSRPGLENIGTTTSVGTYPANQNGLFDMIGNVWEWTTSEFFEGHSLHACCGTQKKQDPFQEGGRLMVLKGGSHLCAENYCSRYRPSARIPQPEYSSASHIGFRVANDVEK